MRRFPHDGALLCNACRAIVSVLWVSGQSPSGGGFGPREADPFVLAVARERARAGSAGEEAGEGLRAAAKRLRTGLEDAVRSCRSLPACQTDAESALRVLSMCAIE